MQVLTPHLLPWHLSGFQLNIRQYNSRCRCHRKDYPEGREGELTGLQTKLEQFLYSYQVAAVPQLFRNFGRGKKKKSPVTDTALKNSYPYRGSGYPQLPSCWRIGRSPRLQEQERQPPPSPGGRSRGSRAFIRVWLLVRGRGRVSPERRSGPTRHGETRSGTAPNFCCRSQTICGHW